LPAPGASAYVVREYEAPVNEVEAAVARIWAEVLKLERVGRNDNFFELGGHSLLAVGVMSRLSTMLEKDVALKDIFAYPVLTTFAEAVRGAARAQQWPITPSPRQSWLPLSHAQQRLWFLAQMDGVSEAYHLPMSLRLSGELDEVALRRALERIVWRHEALRTSFPLVDGEPVQRVAAPESGLNLERHDLSGHADAAMELKQRSRDEAGRRFDLEHGPLIRGQLIRLATEEHVLLITMHHIVSDGWSMGILTHELKELYSAYLRGQDDPLPPLAIQYGDYALWQRQRLRGELLQRQIEYWRRTITGAPTLLDLPTDRPRPAQQNYAGDVVELQLNAALTGRLKALGQRYGMTLYMLVVAGWAAVLSRLSGQEEVVIGTTLANRTRSEIEGLIGFFVNTQALRVDVSGSVVALLERVKARTLDAQEHRDLPFEQVVEIVRPSRSMAHTPLFQAMLSWQSNDEGVLQLPGLTLEPAEISYGVAKFDLELDLGEVDDRIEGGLRYATALFDHGTIERHITYLRQVLEAMVADQRQSVDCIDMVGEAERRQLLADFNNTEVTYPRHACVHELFEAQAALTPNATAVVYEDTRVNYAELNERANQLAHHLINSGVKPDSFVAICMERSVEMVVALLATLKAGGAYVPLEPDYPTERLHHMLEDCSPRVVLTQTKMRPLLGSAATRAWALDVDETAWSQLPAVNLEPGELGLHSRRLAYLIYTSGSTGKPKGVMVEHQAVVNRLLWMQDAYDLRREEPVLQKTPYSFDVSVWEFFWTLLQGATLVMAKPQGHKDPAYLSEVIERERITTVHFVPSMLQAFLEHGATQRCGSVRRVVCSGEALPAALADRCMAMLPHARLHNLYGPTEAAVDVSYHDCLPGEERPGSGVPIGRPVANTALYVLNRERQLAPVGVVGELYIGGSQVARGYLNQPELTAERFTADPYARDLQGRMYRTGDLVRWLPNGEIEYLGRNDQQVKIRGFRIELGEIETRLCEFPAVHESAVLVREDRPGDNRLVAYYTASRAAEAEQVGAELLRTHLSAFLPEYMIPAAYVRLESLPLTPNGKLDRKALPAPEADAFSTREYEAPQGKEETVLADLWTDLLKLDKVGRYDHFFSLGGHSLLAVQVVTGLRQALGVEISIRDLFAYPVLADLAEALRGAARAELSPIDRAERSGKMPLSFAQQRLWFLAQMEGLSEAYHIPLALRLKGELDELALQNALNRILVRHEALRTTFAVEDGEPVQRIASAEDARFLLIEHDLRLQRDARSELAQLTAEEAGTPFDLESGPLIRGRFIRLGEHDHALLITMHHIVADGRSMEVLVNELSKLYSAFVRGKEDPLPALKIQYVDYAVWQRKWFEGGTVQQQADYWKNALGGAPALLDLPTDHPRPPQQKFAGAFVKVALDEWLTNGLRDLSRRNGVTLFMTLTAGWAALLARLSGQQDVVVGIPVANRGRTEIDDLIGFFVNTVALRLDLAGSPTVEELLQRTKAQALATQQYQDIPFEQVVELLAPVRSLAHSPLFQVMFSWQSAPQGKLELPDLQLSFLENASDNTSKFDLTLHLTEEGNTIAGGIEYATPLFDEATIERYAGYFTTLLRAMAEDSKRTVDRLPMLSDTERHQLLYGWNDTKTDFRSDTCVHQLFEEQAESMPDATAVVFGNRSLSYAGLNRRANQLAHYLMELGVKPDDRVAVCVERGLERIVALTAVLKAGGAYVPFDPTYPIERLRFMLNDSAPVALLTQKHLAGLFEGSTGDLPVLDLEAETPPWLAMPDCNPGRSELGLTPTHLVYVIYSSGSTGQPKGVVVQHRSMVNLIHWHNANFALGPGMRSSSIAGFGFDAATWEIWPPLCAGAALILPALADNRPADLLDWWAQQNLDVSFLPTPMAEVAFTHGIVNDHLRTLLIGGDRLRYLPQGPVPFSLVNNYGPTETTVVATSGRIEASASVLPIGRPIANTQIYILDAHREPVPIGVTGELYIGGAGVAKGYLNRPALTSERFLKDPFDADAEARMYRTGDLGRWLADGSIEFLGRNDFQVKIRGFRIELGEIEARLSEHPAIHEAVVMAREDSLGEKQLVAYYTASPLDEAEVDALSAEHLRSRLSAVLPEYMVPAAYVRIESFPLTPNGKLDRKALPAANADAYALRGYDAPRGELETTIAQIWAEVLKLGRVGREDNFFAIGGHSLLVVKVMSLLQRGGIGATVADLFNHPTIESFAASLSSRSQASSLRGAVEIRAGSQTPLFLVHDGYGDEMYFFALAQALPIDLPIYGLPCLSLGEPRLDTLRAMAERMVSLINQLQNAGPYRLAGWSFGGVLAYEIAQLLMDDGHEIEFLGLMDAICPDGSGDTCQKTPEAVLLEMCEEKRLEGVCEPSTRDFFSAASFVPFAPHREFHELFSGYQALRALPENLEHLSAQEALVQCSNLELYSRVMAAYRPRPIGIPVHLYAASERPAQESSLAASLGWERWVPAHLLHIQAVPGSHRSMMKPPHIGTLGQRLADSLAAVMDGKYVS
jgi:amino acid adenylation domain-containing protein